MGEENQLKNRTRASKFSDQNQAPNSHNGNQPKPKSSWGSNIVKGFTADKKTNKHQTTTAAPTRRLLLQPSANSELVTQKIPLASSQTRAKRSLIGDLSCSASATQVHPQGFPAHRRQLSGSRDLFTELEHLRGLLQEAKERELKLQSEVEESRKSARVLELEREVEVRKGEVDDLGERVGLLESEKASLCEQLEVLGSILRANEEVGKKEKEESEVWKAPQSVRDLELDVLELRRLNKELQLQKRNLACKLSAMEPQLASISNSHERDAVAKLKAEVSSLRHANEDLSKQVEGLQLSRLNEVEELAYLRWVNSCLRDELRSSCLVASSRKESTPCSSKKNIKSVGSPDFRKSRCLEFGSPKSVKLIKKLREGSITSEDLSSPETADQHRDKTWAHFEERISPQRRHSISGSKCSIQELLINKKRHDGFMGQNELEKEVKVPSAKNNEKVQRLDLLGDCPQSNRAVAPLDIEKRALRVPNPPPRPSCSSSDRDKQDGPAQIIPPPPPPPPRFSSKSSTATVQRAPQVVEFYHSLMKRDSRKDYTASGMSEGPDVESVRSNMIDEIENRSSHLLAIKADVETQGEFVNALIKEVNCAVYQNIEDVVAFVKWLDDELCYLVDERAVLKHFDWPEKKADTLREAAFGYRDLKMLETEILFYEDDPRVPSDVALKKMVALSEKVERTVYNLHRTRESLMRNCKQFRIPSDWMLDNGIISKIKVGSVKLAKKYMKRVAMEIQSKAVHEKDPSMDYMLLQGVRFAFRIHQFAGGFDSETMHAFEELRDLANLLNRKLMN